MNDDTAIPAKNIIFVSSNAAGQGKWLEILLNGTVSAAPVAPPVIKTDLEMLGKYPENRSFRRGNRKEGKNWKPKQVW